MKDLYEGDIEQFFGRKAKKILLNLPERYVSPQSSGVSTDALRARWAVGLVFCSAKKRTFLHPPPRRRRAPRAPPRTLITT